jgi:hypothetical protein
MRGDAQFCFKLRVEPSQYFVTIRYPERWDALSREEKARAALPVALKLGQYLAYMSSTWHEILVWFGYKSARVVPQFPSAFSWEDNYSNLLGTHLGVRALEQTEKSYDEAMTELLDRELEKLGVQPRATAMAASKKMRGKWYTGNLLIQMKKRHLDIGLDDGYVSPTLVPGVCDGAKPHRYPVSNLILPRASRFGLSVEIEPKEWEGGTILRVVYPDGGAIRLKPEVHFGAIMDHIAEEAMEKYGYDISVEESHGAAELFGDYR